MVAYFSKYRISGRALFCEAQSGEYAGGFEEALSWDNLKARCFLSLGYC